MDVISQQRTTPRRSVKESKAIEKLVAQHVTRAIAERLVDEMGTDPERLKAAAWVEKNLPRADDAEH